MDDNTFWLILIGLVVLLIISCVWLNLHYAAKVCQHCGKLIFKPGGKHDPLGFD